MSNSSKMNVHFGHKWIKCKNKYYKIMKFWINNIRKRYDEFTAELNQMG